MPSLPLRRRRGSSASVRVPRSGSGRWVVPTMLVLMIGGLLWLCTYYLAGQDIPFLRDIGNWNVAIGMGLIIAGFLVSTKWK